MSQLFGGGLYNLALMLFYHQSTIDLIGIYPHYSAEAANLLKNFEQTYDIVLPEAMVEWFSIDRIVETLQFYNDGQRPVSLEHLDRTPFVWHPTETGDLLKQSWLIFMRAVQAMLNSYVVTLACATLNLVTLACATLNLVLSAF